MIDICDLLHPDSTRSLYEKKLKEAMAKGRRVNYKSSPDKTYYREEGEYPTSCPSYTGLSEFNTQGVETVVLKLKNMWSMIWYLCYLQTLSEHVKESYWFVRVSVCAFGLEDEICLTMTMAWHDWWCETDWFGCFWKCWSPGSVSHGCLLGLLKRAQRKRCQRVMAQQDQEWVNANKMTFSVVFVFLFQRRRSPTFIGHL